MTEAMLNFESASDESQAFDDGVLYLHVVPRQKYYRDWSGHVRAGEYMSSEGARFTTVHVISRPAGGEIRGYIQIEDGALLLRTPAYPPDWPELDAEVSRRLGLPVVVTELSNGA